ncbi:hypothetical protein [Streptomyces sp. NBC_00564]|uniref:hypothetical protein n=1 Tax=Streptomyces sp. NBC_00564 TaxID=2903663 RepID=UPI00352C2927|nr:hypothetical protein OG256_19565 [Streptomyces sp. NBC_00564]
MRSYTDLFRTREFTPLFLSSAFQGAAQTVGGLAIATLVFQATESPLLSALSMFGPQLAQVVGATTLLSAADRLAPRATMTGIALAFALGTAAMALPGLPVGAVFNMMNGLMQITGFATGGVLVVLLSPRVTLLTAAALYLAGALVSRLGLSRRPPRAAGRPSVAQTSDELSGHALGLHSSGMLTMQGVSAAVAGAVAQLTSPGTAMAVMAVASLAVTAVLSTRAPEEKGRAAGRTSPAARPTGVDGRLS